MPGPGTVKIPIPVPEIAKQSLGKLFPHLTHAQVVAIQNGQPVPASPDYVAPSAESSAATEADVRRQLAVLRKRYITLHGANALDPWFLERFWAKPPALPSLPKVWVVMLVHGQHKPITVARGMRHFLQQNYPNKQMVLVQSGDNTQEIDGHAFIKIVSLPAMSPAAMLNEAMKHCEGDYIAPFWSCEDLYHPWYLSALMSSFESPNGVMLSHQLGMSVLDPMTTTICTHPAGLANTLIVSRQTELRFDLDAVDEEQSFADSCPSPTIVDSSDYPLNVLRVRMHHAASVRPFEHYFPGKDAGTQDLERDEQTYARLLLESVGFNAIARERPV